MKKIAENYDTCVEDSRKAMRKDTDVKFTFVVDGKKMIVPVTPAQNLTDVNGIYIIEITDGNLRLCLVADKYQNWFRGFITDKGNRFEIDHDTLPNIMKNSQSLHTNGMYPSLLGCEVSELKIGYHQLLAAFHTLARYGEGRRDLKKAKEAVAIFLILLFEGPRLLPVEQKMMNSLTQNLVAVVGTDKELINNWCGMSRNFYDENGYEMEVIISEETSEIVKNAAKTFGIMCRSRWDEWVGEQTEAAHGRQARKQSRGQGSSSSSSSSSKKH
ncbi:hypothetical protein OsI_38831 [Oryza sativa Indica Group]|uniref:rRNA N-glycosylase n=1 Tax=Oryza sativa subsp. indica TaxID=39946 RepID=B8BMM3_ORYSI|nr:hypothetical protein OsI_38831 [Oryza sativa Indica Group]